MQGACQRPINICCLCAHTMHSFTHIWCVQHLLPFFSPSTQCINDGTLWNGKKREKMDSFWARARIAKLHHISHCNSHPSMLESYKKYEYWPLNAIECICITVQIRILEMPKNDFINDRTTDTRYARCATKNIAIFQLNIHLACDFFLCE